MENDTKFVCIKCGCLVLSDIDNQWGLLDYGQVFVGLYVISKHIDQLANGPADKTNKYILWMKHFLTLPMSKSCSCKTSTFVMFWHGFYFWLPNPTFVEVIYCYRHPSFKSNENPFRIYVSNCRCNTVIHIITIEYFRSSKPKQGDAGI